MGIPRNLEACGWTEFDVMMRQAIRNRKANTVSSHPSIRLTTAFEEVKKWLLNYARNANKPTPVASATTTKKVIAPRQMASMRLLKYATSHRKPRKMQAPPYDKGVRKIT